VNASSRKAQSFEIGASAGKARAGECGMEEPRKSYEHKPYVRIVSNHDSLVQAKME
jgi:hypothetical protein